MKSIFLFCLVITTVTFFSCKKDSSGPTEVTEAGYTLSDLVGFWTGSGYQLTVASDGKVAGTGVSANWSISSDGIITGTGSYSYIEGSSFIVAAATWSLQMSADKNSISGIHDVMSPGLHNMSVTLTRTTKPTNLVITSVSENRVILQWKDNSNNEKGFSIERKQGVYGSYSEVGSTNPNITTYTDVFLLKADTNYYYRVRNISDQNTNDYSNEAIAVLSFTPTNLSVISISENEVKLLWNDNSTFEKGFKIERADGNDNFLEIAGVDSNVVSYNDITLNKTQTYKYRVRGYTEHNFSSYSPIVKIAYKQGTLIRTLSGHSNWVRSVSFSPNGQTLASGGDDYKIILWQVSDGTIIRTLSGYTTAISFSPDGQMIASASNNNTIKLWRVSDGTVIRTLSGHSGGIYSVSFSPDGQTLASASLDSTIKLWRVSDGTVIHTLSGHSGWVRSVSFSPDGQTLASSSDDKTIKLWRISDGTLIRTLSGHTSWVLSVSYSPDGQTVASGSDDYTIKLWQVSDGTVIRTLSGHSAWVRAVTFISDGQTLASGSNDNTIKLWQVSDGSLISTLSGHSEAILSVSCSPDGQTLASASYDKTIKLWSLHSFTWCKVQ